MSGVGVFRWVGAALVLAITTGAYAAEVSNAIQSRIENLMFDPEFVIEGEQIRARDILGNLYAARRYQPLWPNREKILELEALVALAHERGLDRDDYPLQVLLDRLPADGLPVEDYDRADIDILATETLLRVGYQLRYGKVNPAGLFADWNFQRELLDGEARSQTIEAAVAAPSLTGWFDNWLQRGPLYQYMITALAEYRGIQAQGGWQMVPEGPTLRLGDTGPRVADLRRRLIVTGDLAGSATGASDSFDAGLEAGVKSFQDRHGLDPDGVVGARSIAAMNVPIAHRIDQLRASLERGRWILDEFRGVGDHDLVLVNIASAEVAVMRGGSGIFRTRAQVGKPYRQTPVFRGDIQYLVMNPDWTVPPGILRNDVIPKLKADPDGYLQSKNMDLLDRDGNVVDHNAVDWTQVTSRNFPYIVRQRPGPWNALGQIKFIFPNPHFVFLHDTPSRELFNRSERAFSSGCIRVENPFALAEIVLAEPDKWNQASLKAVLDEKKLRNIHLASRMPVFILYWTGMAEKDGTVRFYEDIYGRDKVLLEALRGDPIIDVASPG